MAKKSSYMNRAMRSNDRRFATVLGKMGYARSDIRAESTTVKAPTPKRKVKEKLVVDPATKEPALVDEDAGRAALESAREEYTLKIGKRPFMGWDLDTLNERMKEGIAIKSADDKKIGKESE